MPAGFAVPRTFARGNLALLPLVAAMLPSDYEAVMGSAPKLTSVFAAHDDWPLPSMTRAEDQSVSCAIRFSSV